MPVQKIVFVSYGEFDINSAGHIAGFANGLARRGYQVGVCAGKVEAARSFGEPLFKPIDIRDFIADPTPHLAIDGEVRSDEVLLVAWTPREVVRRSVAAASERHRVPYIVHFEDNEVHLTRTWRAARVKRTGSGRGLSRFFRRTPAPSIPSYLTDPEKLSVFLAGASGATVIEERIAELLPAAMPKLTLEPGVDPVLLDASLRSHRSEIRERLGLTETTTMILYPGNVHFANVRDVEDLYRAVGLLRQRPRDVVLVRTGRDAVEGARFLEEASRETGVVTLGEVERPVLLALLDAADLFIQPGRIGSFNDYRLPSKVPEFLATGRPVILPATNVGKRLRHGIDAMLLRDGTAEEIAGHAEAVLDDPELARRLSVNARTFAAAAYDWDRQVEKLEAFIDRVMQ